MEGAMLDVRCWMYDVGCTMLDVGLGNREGIKKSGLHFM